MGQGSPGSAEAGSARGVWGCELGSGLKSELGQGALPRVGAGGWGLPPRSGAVAPGGLGAAGGAEAKGGDEA